MPKKQTTIRIFLCVAFFYCHALSISSFSNTTSKEEIISNKEQIALSLEKHTKEHQMLYFTEIFFLVLALLIVLINNFTQKKKQEKLIKETESLSEKINYLSSAKKKAEESNELKSTFLANMSHEIRTPLNAIVGFSSLITEENLENKEKETYTDIIQKSSQLLLNLINDLLDLSKLEAKKYNFDFKRCNLDLCCQQALKIIESSHKKEEVQLFFSTSEKKDQTLITDEYRLQQVLINLLNNALKFTSKGNISLKYKVNHKEEKIYFYITDTGKGIPKEKQKLVFNRFEKLNPQAQGSGLGLSICKLIVKQLGGRIWIDSNYEQGTRVIFTHATSIKQEVPLIL